ncbi:MAG: PQQ-binding-like beta-propeller repeat protein, partial [Planctomycetota bacterium]|nr:PQQ-binding-like beta-propeller repeat protein [Planctomycetota bacterium]
MKRSMWQWTFLAGLLCGMAVPESQAAAGDGWPQFRGPTADGIAPNADPPTEWSETKNIAWKVALPWHGKSSPVLQGDRIWLTTCVEQNMKRTRIGPDDMQVAAHVTFGAACLSATDGKTVWQTTLADIDNPAPVHCLNSWATPTPVLEAGKLYCDFGTFGTACVNAEDGKIAWQQKVPLDHQVGPGSSPALCGNALVLVRDGRDAQYMAALDKATGQQMWKTNRPPLTGSGDTKKSFSSPLQITSGGTTQVVSVGARWVVSYDPASGKELWRARHSDGWSIGACPVFGNGVVYLSSGCTKPQLVAIRAGGSGDVTATHTVWKSLRGVPVMSSPILVGEEIYWVSDTGVLSCSSAKTGDQIWQQKLNGSVLASPTYAGGKLYVFSQDGVATVFKPGKQFEKIAENTLSGPLVATPAFVGKAIFVRTDSQFYRVEQTAK